jgi:hypothetical protein
MEIKKSPKVAEKFNCELCLYTCCKKSDYTKHLSTNKHTKALDGNDMEVAVNQKNRGEFVCINCHKKYSTNSGLWKHSKKCKQPQKETENKDMKSLTYMVVELIKSNQELQKQMADVCCKLQPITNTIHSNSHNKTFNMQFFLNEQCKDAMNIMDFVDTVKLQFSDLERVGEVGYIEGISDIIIKKLNELDIYKRPIHCSDAKRETLYVKDNNIWEKENGNHNKLRLAIKHITKKNTDMLNPWRIKHPGSCDSDNYLNDIYLEMVMQAMGGRGGMEENENKIIRKIAKTVLIDK